MLCLIGVVTFSRIPASIKRGIAFMSNLEEYSELEKLYSRLSEGSAEAFKILYDKRKDEIYRYCLRILGDEATARDAFQETFIKMY